MKLTFALFLCLSSSVAFGWVDSLSSPSSKPSSTLAIDVPLGSYITVWGPWKDPAIVADESVEWTIYWLVGNRKQITPERTGYPKASVMDIPYYLLPDTKSLDTIDFENDKIFRFGEKLEIMFIF